MRHIHGVALAALVSAVAGAAWGQAPPAAASPASAPPAPPAPAAAPAGAAAPPAAWTDEPAPSPADVPTDPPPPTELAPAEGATEPAAPAPPSVAPPAVVESPPDRADEPAPLTKHRQYDLGFELGVRNVVATDPSYDPYSEDDALTAAAFAVTWMPLQYDLFTVGLVGEWDPGGSTGSARGDATSLFVHRASVGAQARLALGSRVYLHARVAPSMIFVSTSIEDPAIPRPLEADSFTWGLDATGGAAVLIARAGDPDAPAFRLWVVGEVGYAFAGAAELAHEVEAVDDDPRRYGGVTLAALDTSGVVNRFALALTF